MSRGERLDSCLVHESIEYFGEKHECICTDDAEPVDHQPRSQGHPGGDTSSTGSASSSKAVPPVSSAAPISMTSAEVVDVSRGRLTCDEQLALQQAVTRYRRDALMFLAWAARDWPVRTDGLEIPRPFIEFIEWLAE